MTENLSTKIVDENYDEILANIKSSAEKVGKTADDIILLAATKTVSPEVINYAIKKGIKYIGENRVQEFLSKDDQITKDVHRHFIGHLQTNKVRDIVDKVEMIQSVHSEKLALEIDRKCESINKCMDILLEVNIGNEESKSGFLYDQVASVAEKISKLKWVKIKGLMAIPPICETKSQIIEYFNQMNKLFIDIRAKNIDNVDMVYLSMGMSDDYVEAILSGANIVRIGSSLFGKRIYK